VIPVNQVISYLTDATCGSGATLNVADTGVITPNNCTFLGVVEVENENNILFYPSLVNEVLNIGFVNEMSGNAEVIIYNVNGQEVYTYVKQIASEELMILNLEKLANGIYVCKIQLNEKLAFKKFIKQ